MELKRQLGLGSATAAVVGEVIAVGIFLTPAGMAKALGSPFWILAVWLVMGAMVLCGALCYGELAARYPQAGGGYVYLREAYGPQVAFLYGWMCFLVMDPGITAALAVGFGSYLGYLLTLGTVGVKATAIIAILVIGALNVVGASIGAGVLRWLTWLKLGLLAAIVLWAVGGRMGDLNNFLPLIAQRPGSQPLAGAFGAGLIGAFFAFGGWWDVSMLAGEVREPGVTLPRALVLGVTLVTAIYVITSAVFLYLVPLSAVTSGETFAAQAGEALFGRAGGRIFSVIVMISVLGSLAGILMTHPRVYYAMARDGLFLSRVATIDRRFGTPSRAIVLQAIMAVMLVLLGSFGEIISYFVFMAILFVALTVAGIFLLRRHSTRPWSGYRTAGYPVTPIIFLVLVGALLVLLAMRSPKQALLGAAVVGLGAPVYHLFLRRRLRALSETSVEGA
jgi:basic amino acid/polyamine antiporter, APA family